MTSRIILAHVTKPPAQHTLFSAGQVLGTSIIQETHFDTLKGKRDECETSCYSAKFLTIPNGSVIVTGREIFYLNDNQEYFPDYYPKPWVYQERLRAGRVIEIDLGSLPEYHIPVSVFAPFLVAGNWFHTLLDNYARMYFFDFLESPDLKIIIPFWAVRPGPAFRDDRRLVNAVFMEGHQPIVLNEGIYRFDKIILPPLGNRNDYIFCKPLEFVAARLRKALLPEPAFHKSKFFISRADSDVRNISNESELLAALRPLGVTPICPGDYSFRSQIELFASAELLLGAHGQGFMPMICAEDCKRVMELEAANWKFTAYRSIASCFDIPYEKLSCKLIEYRDTARFDWLAEADIAACVAQVEAALQAT